MMNLNSWLDIPLDSDFSIYNLPLGIFSTADNALPRVGIAIGDHVLDVSKLAATAALKALVEDAGVFQQPSLSFFPGQCSH